ncbi:MAG: insulinase family protein [Clostridia bacterium]|nr:insulinase family protein [Clostridia bacterium]
MSFIAEKNGVSYSFIKTSRFKTTLISVGFYLPLTKNAAANALALRLMKSGTLLLPDTYSFNRKLASLYGAKVSAWVSKVGDCQELRLGIAVNDDKFSLNGEQTVTEAANLICDMIFSRHLSGESYPADAIEREKRLQCEAIAGKINEKRIFARNRLEEIMCKGEPFGLATEGSVEETSALTSDDVNTALKRLINTAFISVQVVGEKEPDGFYERLTESLEKTSREFKSLNSDVVLPAGEIKRITETMPVKQGKLVLGFRSDTAGCDRETVATLVMCDIFGGGPYSKLFCNVREKMSLCYYCAARAIRRKGLLVVDSGVEDSNIDSAEKAILSQLEDMKNGNFTEKELEFSKLAICDSVNSVESDQNSLLHWYAARSLEKNPTTPEEMCELIKNITAEDIKKAAEKFMLDTVYTLRPDGTKKEEE